MNSPFTRIQYLIGSLGINLLQEAHVVVVGLGGVGGMSAGSFSTLWYWKDDYHRF